MQEDGGRKYYSARFARGYKQQSRITQKDSKPLLPAIKQLEPEGIRMFMLDTFLHMSFTDLIS